MISFFDSFRSIRPACSLAVFISIAITTFANAQSVYFDPADTIPNDPVFDVPIALDCAADFVKGIELIATYDPSLVQLTGISAGPLFSDSGQSFYFYDYTNIDPQGTIHFASAMLDGALSGVEVLAICHFSIVGIGVSPLVFQDVDVRDGANLSLAFSNSIGDKITIDPAVADKEQTFGALKAIYR